ncbi:MAG: chemotaxis protein CheX [Bdellovibrio sp.]
MPFEFIPQNDYLIINLSGDCLGDEKPSLTETYQQVATQNPVKYILFQTANCNHMSSSFMREIALIYKALKSVNGGLRLVGTSEKVKSLIVAQGLDMILVTKLSLRGALVDFGLAKEKQLDVNFINPFLSATQRVFKIQCFLDVTPGKPFIKKSTDPLLLGDVSGIISISSETFNGTLAISLPEAIFLKIGTNMTGEPIEKITETNIDLVGELANIILGQAKLELNKLGFSIQMAIPSCVWGKDHKIKHYGGSACVVIPFETATGTFYAEIMTEQITSVQNKAA